MWAVHSDCFYLELFAEREKPRIENRTCLYADLSVIRMVISIYTVLTLSSKLSHTVIISPVPQEFQVVNMYGGES